jgi:lipid-binding SYLF domain-containing protein
MRSVVIGGVFLCMMSAWSESQAWDPNEFDETKAMSEEAVSALLEKDPEMQRFLDEAVAYVVIPSVGKAGIGIGGARGKGLLFEGGEPTRKVTLTQLSIGFQLGGQVYSEFIFFKDEETLDIFKKGNFELGAQMSAVAVTIGASADADYTDGVAIFTQAKGGLMYEASVGGQKFKITPLK